MKKTTLSTGSPGSNSPQLRSKSRKRRAGQACLFGLAATFVAAGHTKGDMYDDYWIQPAGGSWDNAANWSLGYVPYANADFNLATGSPYVVTTGAPEHLGGDLNVLNTSVTINAGAGDGINLLNFNVNASSGQNTSVTINAGTGDSINMSNLNVNASAGQATNFTFNGSSVDGTDGSGMKASSGELEYRFGGVGGAGAVSFNFNNGMFTDDPNPFAFGAGSTTVFNNAKILATMAISGSVTANSSTGRISNVSIVGSAASPGLLTIMGGSTFTTPIVAIGNNDGTLVGPSVGYGVVDVSGVGTQLISSYRFEIGSEGPFSSGGDGTGTLNVTAGGQVSAVQFYVGSIGSLGTVAINGTGSLISCSSAVNIAGGSSVGVTGGGKLATNLLNLSSGSTLAIGLDEGGISISGRATLVGTLNVTLGTTPDATAGETFDLLTFGSESGAFSTIDLPPLDPGLSWSTQNLYTNGSISVVAVPEPASLSLGVLTIAGMLSKRRRTLR